MKQATRLRDPQRGATYEGKKCGRCGSTTRLASTRRCRDCNKNWARRAIQSAPQRALNVGKPCPICTKPMDQPCSDEDPVTGVHRGWVCHSCNMGIGQFYDSPVALRAAADYLEQSLTTPNEGEPSGLTEALF